MLVLTGAAIARSDGAPSTTIGNEAKRQRMGVLETVRYIAKSIFPSDSSDRPDPQKISVIGAGHGRTGTSSLRVALNRLGLKSYHMEAVLQTPGHVDLWHAFYHQQRITIDDVLDRIEADGFNATLDAPTNYFFEHQLARNPSAKVILTLRNGGADSWVKSMHESVLLFHPLIQRVPFRWMPRMKRQSQLFQAINMALGVPVVGPAKIPARESMADAYDRWTEHVKSTVPTDQLLVFYAQDGWEPLCEFLAPVSHVVEANCREVLTSGEPYPHVNDTVFIRRMAAGLGAACYLVESLPAVLSLFLVLTLLRRYGTDRHSSERKEKSL